MEQVNNYIGSLKGMIDEAYYLDGSLMSCRLEAYNELETPFGKLVPSYNRVDTRTKFRPSLCFYPTGELKSIYLDDVAMIKTNLGERQAELITFYKEGTIHRLFPLYGQISGYWTEEEEYTLAKEEELQIGEATLRAKVSSYCFYPSGKVKSLTFWDKEAIVVSTSKSSFGVRLGLAFYENGNLKSFEPYLPTLFHTPIGDIMAYHNNPIGVHGDTNSAVFTEGGELKQLCTIQTSIFVVDGQGNKAVFQPKLIRNPMEVDQWVRRPLEITFDKEQVSIDDGDTQTKMGYVHTYITEPSAFPIETGCSAGCSKCKGCS